MEYEERKRFIVISRTRMENHTPPGEFEFEATRQMFDMAPNSYRLVLSARARELVEAHDLGDFHIRVCEKAFAIMVVAPNDHARVMFRLAF